MGKASKKMKRQAQKNAAERNLQQCQPKVAELEECFVHEDYSKVLEILAELIQAGYIKPDLLYKGAYSYFMLGDYERAAQWINNTLSYDNHHVDARILLARLCFIQDRHDEGLALYDFLVKNYRAVMSQEQKDQIMDSTEYCVRREGEKIRQAYPALADFLQVMPAAENIPVQAAGADNKMKGQDALSALQRLKAKLKAVQVDGSCTEPAKTEAATEETQDKAAEATEITAQAEQQIAEVRAQQCSLRDKIRILNQFAAGQYAADDYECAEKYLKAALQIDAEDAQSLRNMAVIQAAMGDLSRAQAFAAKLPQADLALLYILKEQQANG